MAKLTVKELSEKTSIPRGTWTYWLLDSGVPREKAEPEGPGFPPYLYDPQDILDWWKRCPYDGISLKRYYSVKEKLKHLSD